MNEAVEGIRRRHAGARPNPTENPAWANSELDLGLLLGHYDALAAELAECRSSRQREHDLRVKIAGDLEGTQEAFRRSDDKRAAAEAERDALKADDEAWRKSSLVQILADRDRAMELLRRARHWMNEAVGRNWQTHDAVNPGLFDSIDAALAPAQGDAAKGEA